MAAYGLRYEGPIYRPPSEALSLLVQATIGCPHNRCTFCTVYKKGPKFSFRPLEDIKEDLRRAREALGPDVRTVFFPSGNTIHMPTDDQAEMYRYTRELFPDLERITIYASAQFIVKKGAEGMKALAEAGLDRMHVGLESGDDIVLKRVKKGSTAEKQIEAGKLTKDAGIQLSEYVLLGIGGRDRTKEHVEGTVRVLNAIDPDFIRLRTFLPKINTPILKDIDDGTFEVLSPHEVLTETRDMIRALDVTSELTSDHYTNYVSVDGRMPGDREKMLAVLEKALKKPESSYRKVYIGCE
jgi:radical SAM superfamily enzyme YgiQ (UPF0313 family)